jgi:hypothetical protein
MARTIQEKAIDRLFALYVIDRCRAEHGITDVSETKLHKLIFYAQKKLIECRCKAMNYSFIKLLYPTFSNELRTDLNELADLGFLHGQYYREQEKARMILEDFHHIFDSNPEIKCLVDEEVDRYAPVETNALVSKTKHLPWRDKIIDDLKNGTPLLYPLRVARSRCILNVTDEDLEDLAICLSPAISAGMEQAFDELRRGKRLTHEEVFG